jgi:transketolase-like protein
MATMDLAVEAVRTASKSTNDTIDHLCVNTIRTLAMDAVQAANSGHPGTGWPWRRSSIAFGSAFCAPSHPIWPNRDRFGVVDRSLRRCCFTPSQTDVEQAYAVGRAAVEFAIVGKNAVMPAIRRVVAARAIHHTSKNIGQSQCLPPLLDLCCRNLEIRACTH